MAFKIGINMAGAVSAGAYTAGVLDFLIQALNEWYEAKKNGEAVPAHDVSLEVLSGASAGGMCAAIGSVALHESFPPVTSLNPTGDQSLNKLYSSWVEKIDISSLLETKDLSPNQPVVSVLDSTVLQEIANYALTLEGPSVDRPYVSNSLTLFLTLTNLRGVVYDIDPANGGTFEEQIAYYADYLQFQTVASNAAGTQSKLAKLSPLDKTGPDSTEWSLLRQAAMATGAFPVMLAPRVLARDVSDYNCRPWVVANPDTPPVPSNPADPSSPKICNCQQFVTIPPDWGSGAAPTQISTVNVDGGVTNNNPFDLASRYLAALDPQPAGGHMNSDAASADRALITIAPFPGKESFRSAYDEKVQQGLFPVIGSLIDALVSQSRFQGESIRLLKSNDNFSRFVIAPNGDQSSGQPTLMSSNLGAFAGFLGKKFRQHDFQLGRRNCQWFLKQHFVLQEDNPVIAAGLGSNTSRLAKFKAGGDAKFKRPDPARGYWPIIPLCRSAAEPVQSPPLQTIPESEIKNIAGKAADRLLAVAKALARDSPAIFRAAISLAGLLGKGKIRNAVANYVTGNLGAAVEKGR